MTTRVADYARFSTDLQDERSIPDQQRLCQELAERIAPGCSLNRNFDDAALSSSSMINRPGLQVMLRAARAREFDYLVVESLDRLSRDQADLPTIYKILTFAGVRLFTVEEGEIDETDIATQGVQSAKFWRSLASKTRRGLRGQVERGKSAGGLSYGYRVDRSRVITNKRGEVEIERGVLVVHLEEAAVVLRIITLFVSGTSPKAIAQTLNREGIPGPRGRAFSPSTIHGHHGRGTGILNNELYIGRRVWNRQRFLKNPDTGKRVARPNPPSEWIIEDVQELRIPGLTDDLWQEVKARQAATRQTMKAGIVRARRPIYLFSGLTECGGCGGGYTVSSRSTLRCFNNTARGTCTNARAITRQELEARVLRAMRERFFEPGVFDEFCRAFTEEMNRLRQEHRAKLVVTPREIEAIDRRQKQILDYLTAGFGGVEAWKQEVRQNEARRAELQAIVAAAQAEPPLPALHPRMADVFRQKTMQLAAALEHADEEQRESARQALRDFIDRIVIPPGDGLLQVVGNLGEMLTAAGGRNGSAAVAYVGCGGGI